MKLICVGGVSSGCGKTSVAALLISAFPRWAALKVTPCRPDGACPHARNCGACEPPEGGFEIVTDRAVLAQPDTDTSRLLAAGASRVVWLRALPECLPEALQSALAVLSDSCGVIVESTTAIPLVQGYRILVANERSREIKDSARACMAHVDLVVVNLMEPDTVPRGGGLDAAAAAPVVHLCAALPWRHALNRQFIELCRSAVYNV